MRVKNLRIRIPFFFPYREILKVVKNPASPSCEQGCKYTAD